MKSISYTAVYATHGVLIALKIETRNYRNSKINAWTEGKTDGAGRNQFKYSEI